jgi:hypothetical protein
VVRANRPGFPVEKRFTSSRQKGWMAARQGRLDSCSESEKHYSDYALFLHTTRYPRKKPINQPTKSKQKEVEKAPTPPNALDYHHTKLKT